MLNIAVFAPMPSSLWRNGPVGIDKIDRVPYTHSHGDG